MERPFWIDQFRLQIDMIWGFACDSARLILDREQSSDTTGTMVKLWLGGGGNVHQPSRGFRQPNKNPHEAKPDHDPFLCFDHGTHVA